MTPRSLRVWSFLHTWSSLVCTLVALMLCVTGLPLIFHEELGPQPVLETPDPAAPPASLDAMVAAASAARPGAVVPYLFFDRDLPVVKVPTAATMTADPSTFHYQVFDLRTGQAVAIPQPNEGFLYVMLRLHADLFAGLPGMLFLGGMGGLLVLAIVSGVVLYGPFTRRLSFGEIRRSSSARRTWLDLHNLLGIATAAWFGVVALTGMINTLAAPIELAWQSGQLLEMAAQEAPSPSGGGQRVPLDAVIANIRAEVPGMDIMTVALPGSPFSTRDHIAVFLTGNTPLTSRILKPALADAASGKVVAVRDMPWYATMLFVSQPLHFGDYGGLPLKIIWAILDVVAIVVLGSGLYLWLARKWRRERRAVQMAPLS